MARKKSRATRKPRGRKASRSKAKARPRVGKARSKAATGRTKAAARSKGAKAGRAAAKPRAKAARSRPVDLLGPPPREATLIRGDRAREMEERLAQHHSTSPKLSGGDVDADWERAASAGEEAVGGTVATPDQSVVDGLGAALGVPRAPDEPVRTAQEILEARDRQRARQEG